MAQCAARCASEGYRCTREPHDDDQHMAHYRGADGQPHLWLFTEVAPTEVASPGSMDEAIAARDEALERVEAGAEPDWQAAALAALEITARRLPDFISDDVWDSGLPSTREDRALGPIFLAAARAGWIAKTDRVRPSRRSHASGKPVWRSLIYR